MPCGSRRCGCNGCRGRGRFAVFLGEVGDHLLLLRVGHRAVETHHLRLAEAELPADVLGEELHRGDALGEDDDALLLVGLPYLL